MLYVCEYWSQTSLIVFDSTNNRLAHQSGDSVIKAIKRYIEGSWGVATQPYRNICIENNVLHDDGRTFPVIAVIDLDIAAITDQLPLKYPEFLL